jgi:hypothetical protein
MNQELPIIPDFASWTRENLDRFAAESFIKLQDQRALIQHLRQLIANTPENHSGKPS